MKRASITEAKNNLSALIDGLKGGASVLIVDRGRPVARLEPVIERGEDQEGRLSRAARAREFVPGAACRPHSACASRRVSGAGTHRRSA